MADDDKIERSGSGSPIYRYANRASNDKIVTNATPYLERIDSHLERWIGPAPMVFHEITSPTIHIDIHAVPPSGRAIGEGYPMGMHHFTFVTSGVSTYPMNVPAGAEEWRYAELMIALPPDWPGLKPDATFDQSIMSKEENWWPFRWLKSVARLPHQYNSWLGSGHTIPNGDPPEPFAPGTGFCCMMLVPTLLIPREARRIVVSDDVVIHFYALWPLYAEELSYKLEHGMGPLMDRLLDAGVSEIIDRNRVNVCV